MAGYDVNGMFDAIKEIIFAVFGGIMRTLMELEWYYKVIIGVSISLILGLFMLYTWIHRDDIHIYDF